MSFRKDTKSKTTFSKITIGLESPDSILDRSSGEVLKPETINYRTYKPERDGLFCERIFGPVKDYECHCGKYKRIRYKGIVCDRCGVEVTEKKVRRERIGHIQLTVPVAHIWYFRSLPNKIGYLLGIPTKKLDSIIYYEKYVVIQPGIKEADGVQKLDFLTEEEYLNIIDTLPKENQMLDDSDPNKFIADMGASALYTLLAELDLDELSYSLRNKANTETSQQRKAEALKRLQVVEEFRSAKDVNRRTHLCFPGKLQNETPRPGRPRHGAGRCAGGGPRPGASPSAPSGAMARPSGPRRFILQLAWETEMCPPVDILGGAELFHDLKAFQRLGLALLRRFGIGLVAQRIGQLVQVEFGQQGIERGGAHVGDELVRVGVVQHLVFLRQGVDDVQILLLSQEVEFLDAVGFLDTGLDDHILLIIDDGVELLGRNAEQITDLVRQRTEVPDVRHRNGQLDVADAFAAHLLLGNLHAAAVADDTFVADAFVLAAVALVILYRTEDALAEQTVPLGLVRTVVDGFRFEHLAARTVQYRIGRFQTDGDLAKRRLAFCIFSE